MSNDIPAFPIPLNHGESYMGHSVCDGMTLRDYFAAKELSKTVGACICDVPESYERLAEHCYRMADAMLEARK